jgi:uncharacterized membrane protein YoaK (UPF0700 family)
MRPFRRRDLPAPSPLADLTLFLIAFLAFVASAHSAEPSSRRATYNFNPGWKLFVGGALTLGLLVVLGFWCGFLADYPLTRDVYFTVAMLHVLAEAPFLLRMI